MNISVLMTCFNRRDYTLACLRLLYAQALPEGDVLNVVLVDDGSKDGTTVAVANEFPEVQLLEGDGSLYWCGGMRKAWAHAALADPDYLLLLNDDTMLKPDAILSLLSIAPNPSDRVIAVGPVADPDSNQVVYGGRPPGVHVHPPQPGEVPIECNTFNANCVLIPRGVSAVLGGFYDGYTHGFADFDYGVQARRKGIRILQGTRIVGTCRLNSDENTWRDARLPRLRRFQLLRSPKAMPFREHLAFARRTQGAKWFKFLLSPYFRILLGK
jgi:GT2 family glycosyltransferase